MQHNPIEDMLRMQQGGGAEQLPPGLAALVQEMNAGFAGLPVGDQGFAGLPQQGQMGNQMSAEDHKRVALEHLQAAIQMEPDDQDSQVLARVIQGLYSILARRQKEQESALGINPALKALSRSSGGPQA